MTDPDAVEFECGVPPGFAADGATAATAMATAQGAQPFSAECSRRFKAHGSSGSRAASSIRLIVIHSTEGSTAAGAAGWFENPASKGSAHLCVDDRECFRTLSDDAIPWGAIGANTSGVHIEIAGFAKWSKAEWLEHTEGLRRAAYKAAQFAKKYEIPVELLNNKELKSGKSGIVTHAQCAVVFDGSHTDPGPNFPLDRFIQWAREFAGGAGEVNERRRTVDHGADWPWFAEWALWTLGREKYAPFGKANRSVRPSSAPSRIPKRAVTILDALSEPEAPKPAPGDKPAAPGPITVRSKLLSPPRASKGTIERYVLGRAHAPRTDAEAREVVGHYVEFATAGGLDPLVAVAQMVLETGNLTSDWSQPPHRNLAGIGITSDDADPDEVPRFRTWKTAVRAHVGRLLAYSVPLGEETPAQAELVDAALKARPLPDDRRGKVTTLSGLAGTWATDPDYARSIRRIANEARAA